MQPWLTCDPVYFRSLALCLLPSALCLILPPSTHALPPPEDLPEEIMRGEIITEARSPLDGKPLTAAQYAEVQASLQTIPVVIEQLPPGLRNNLFLLRIRRLIRTVIPLPIKAF
ncbi:MAG: hypothetical protein SFW36_15615 [Leptolyngbyaceae cyanobacterium bins.59]|nr:hypothetical protein [Leptolyngbyaceae cyanobacterium bins.59]